MNREARSLDTRAFGLACALLWSGAVIVLEITARFGWGKRWQRLLADVYRGYDGTVSGLIAGAIWPSSTDSPVDICSPGSTIGCKDSGFHEIAHTQRWRTTTSHSVTNSELTS